MKHKEKLQAILKTMTFVFCVVLIGLLISACQSNVQFSNVSLPSENKPLITKQAT